uniref:Uncharacterized protein n=1 Tax=Periophthalmus magnuspinnatus TaxID=409849 RepID=A0A3B4B8D2_9GOBI
LASLLSLEDHLLCSICLDLFTDPVSTPCEHIFCRVCITKHWESSSERRCPLCKTSFSVRPDLRVNPLFSQVVSQVKTTGLQTVRENRRRMLNRRQKMEEIRAVLEQSQTQAETQMQEMVEIFSELVENVQSCLDQYSEIVEKTLTKHEERAQALMSELEQEICDLEQSSTEEWSSVIFKRAAFEGTTVRALSALGNDLSKTQRRVQEAELKRVQRCAVDVTLDPDTAHCKLILSKDNKKVHQSDSKKKSPENEERFSESCLVLGRPAFSSGRFYFEVQVDEKTPWQIGLVTVSIDRKQQVTLRPSAGVWAVELGEGEQYRALDEAPVPLSPRRPLQKVGVFADHIEGVVSFHDVDTGDIVFSFSGCDFTEDLIPFLSPGTRSGKNSAPLVITTTTVEEQDIGAVGQVS